MTVQPVQFVTASANPDKVAEIAAILEAELGDVVTLLARPDGVPDVVEDADTLEGNARLKAEALARATGLPAVADDTGLEVDALGGAPGVWSARYAGEGCSYADNVAKLLEAMGGITDDERSARFHTVALVRWPDGRELVAHGTVEGRITAAPRGANGFGYDCVFSPLEAGGRTFAEMAPSDKHAISHRGRALRAIGHQLRRSMA